MITFLSRFFIKDYKDYASPQVRQSYGMLCGAVGIALNIFLFLGKWLAGMLSGSIAITADAFNNLSDAGSSVITLVGFKLSGQKPDTEHPFGHGRMEYISGLLVSVAVLIMGFELIRSSIDKIRTPEPIELTDDQTKLGAPTDFEVTVRNLKISAGAGFIVALTGEIMTMPGLPKVPAAEKIDVDETGKITGLF